MADIFPVNVVDVLFDRISVGMPDHVGTRRSLSPSDPMLSFGVFATEWATDEDSMEIGGTIEPLLNRYRLQVQNMVLSTDESLGRDTHTANSKIVRTILYRDPVLHASLRGLEETVLGSTERVKRFGITRQEFLSGARSSQWMFLTQTHFWLETEKTP